MVDIKTGIWEKKVEESAQFKLIATVAKWVAGILATLVIPALLTWWLAKEDPKPAPAPKADCSWWQVGCKE